MTNIFICGSRKVSHLNKVVLDKLDEVMCNNEVVLIGDANGIDKSIQKYLFSKTYPNVIVFCVDQCRNNIGEWEINQIKSVKKRKDINYYARKDMAMINLSNYGLIIWNEESKGTYNNLLALLRQDKKIFLYSTKKKEFLIITNYSEIGRVFPGIGGPLFTHVM